MDMETEFADIGMSVQDTEYWNGKFNNYNVLYWLIIAASCT